MKKTKRITERELGRDEGVAWVVATLVKDYGTGTEARELAQAWGMDRLLLVADETDLPHLERLCKDYKKQFRGDRAKARASRGGGKGNKFEHLDRLSKLYHTPASELPELGSECDHIRRTCAEVGCKGARRKAKGGGK